MKVTVTQDDIDRGCKHDAHDCPIARAVSRALYILEFDEQWCSIGPVTCVFDDGYQADGKGSPSSSGSFRAGYTELRLPPEVTAFVSRFDRDKPVRPFVFFLDYTGPGSGFADAPLVGEEVIS